MYNLVSCVFSLSIVSWVLQPLKFPNIHPFSATKKQAMFNLPTSNVCSYSVSQPIKPRWLFAEHVWAASRRSSTAGLDREGNHTTWKPGSSLPPTHSIDAAYRSPSTKWEKSSLYICVVPKDHSTNDLPVIRGRTGLYNGGIWRPPLKPRDQFLRHL